MCICVSCLALYIYDQLALLISLNVCFSIFFYFFLKASVNKKENAENELSGDDENQKTTPKKKGFVI